ncbi:hypothetical protein [Elizabethkingia meningoseptica]|uniref:hypothetical protein n=1 Tax=Elizabethkingia meningoseptica TaxID=238 RepID=UPI0015909218|nr:hypothetical protein [Elizabethkingia meningoseptica]
MENLQGGKFFGTVTSTGPCDPIGDTGRGMQYVEETFYAFWLPVSSGGRWVECAV